MYFRYAIFRALFITLTDFVPSTSTNTVWSACEKKKKTRKHRRYSWVYYAKKNNRKWEKSVTDGSAFTERKTRLEKLVSFQEQELSLLLRIFFLNVTKTYLFFLFVRWKTNTCRLAFFPRVRNKQLVILDSYYVVRAKSFWIIINPLLTKLVRSRRLYISLVLFFVLWISTSFHSIETRKELRSICNHPDLSPPSRLVNNIHVFSRQIKAIVYLLSSLF